MLPITKIGYLGEIIWANKSLDNHQRDNGQNLYDQTTRVDKSKNTYLQTTTKGGCLGMGHGQNFYPQTTTNGGCLGEIKARIPTSRQPPKGVAQGGVVVTIFTPRQPPMVVVQGGITWKNTFLDNPQRGLSSEGSFSPLLIQSESFF